jgi:hypothetical protein
MYRADGFSMAPDMATRPAATSPMAATQTINSRRCVVFGWTGTV